jgi:hypothetical protein
MQDRTSVCLLSQFPSIPTSGAEAKPQGDKFNCVHLIRDNKTAIELFLVGVQDWELLLKMGI